MGLQKISPKDFLLKANYIWSQQWLLLTAGDFNKGDFNTMTIGWGSFGDMWNKPFVQVVVRPTRFTFELLEKYNSFTVTAFDPKYKNALQLLGSKSGRDGNKIEETELTPTASELVDAPTFKEAELSVECRKIYWDDFKPEQFLDDTIEINYPQKDYHRIYFGEILNILGEEKYQI